MFGKIGMQELLIILTIVLVIFGAGRLPEIGKGLGKAIRNFKKASDGLDDVIAADEGDKGLKEEKNKIK